MSLILLEQLFQAGQLRRCGNRAHPEHEQRSLNRLEHLPARNFLQDYDLLFRYVSRWLGEHGYELTNKQPHQVLARVCEQFSPPPTGAGDYSLPPRAQVSG